MRIAARAAATLLAAALAAGTHATAESDLPQARTDFGASPEETLDLRPSDRLRIASGPLGHTYDRIYAVNVLRKIEGYKGYAQRTRGSAENLDLLARGDAEIGFTQADVYVAATRRQGGMQDLLVLGSLAPECLYVAYRADSPVQSLDQLRGPIDGRNPSVAIGPPEGGANATWHNLAFLDPRLEAAEVHEESGALALNQLALGRFDAVVWVTDPRNWEHTNLRIVNGNRDLGLMPIDDPILDVEMRDGIRMYERRTVTTSPGWFGSGIFGGRLRTLCTRTLVVARADAAPSLVSSVADLVGLYGDWLSQRHLELH